MAQATDISTQITRRVAITAVLASAAVPIVAAVPTAAMTIGTDPIFAAIEASRAAQGPFSQAVDERANMDDIGDKTDEELAALYAADDEVERTADWQFATMWKVIKMPATTIAGVVAGLEYLAQQDEDSFMPADYQPVLMEATAAALKRIAAAVPVAA